MDDIENTVNNHLNSRGANGVEGGSNAFIDVTDILDIGKTSMPIAVLDSGIGGLSVLIECIKRAPKENYLYVRDLAFMPYGLKPLLQVKKRVEYLTARIIDSGAKALVLACNTATTAAIDCIRATYPKFPIVGLEPALKPAYEALTGGYCVMLVTQGTYSSLRFKNLISRYDQNKIVVLPQKSLAEKIERNIYNLDTLYPDIEQIFSPYKNAQCVVLGCSHYSFLKTMIAEFLGNSVKIFDGAAGCSARVIDLLAKADNLNNSGGVVKFIKTSSTRL